MSYWDLWLPYLLFAFREVPQSSSGFSRFELLYGREVREPLTLLKELWEGSGEDEVPVDVVSYVVQMRERLENMSALAQTHIAEARQQQRTRYNESAHQCSFDPGQKVLMLLPSQESKLLVKWQGPFEVMKKLRPTTSGCGSRLVHQGAVSESS